MNCALRSPNFGARSASLFSHGQRVDRQSNRAVLTAFRSFRERDVSDDVTGDFKLAILQAVNQAGSDRVCAGRRDSQPDSMLLTYKG